MADSDCRLSILKVTKMSYNIAGQVMKIYHVQSWKITAKIYLV